MHGRSLVRMLLVTAISMAVFIGGVALQGSGQKAGILPGVLETITAHAAETRVTTANLNLRTGPGTGYPVILTIPKGTALSVESYSGTWAKVTYGGKTGYCSTTYLAPPTTAIRYTTDELNLRTGPGTGYEIILAMPAGSKVEMLSASDGWAKVTYEGTTGYASTAYLTSTAPGPGTPTVTVRYTTANLNLRTGAGTSYPIILTMPKGSRVEVLSESGGWARLTYEGKTGYASTSYLTATAPGTGTPTVVTKYTTANLNLRTGPGTNYSIILTIPRGAQVTVLSTANGWSNVTYSGRTGYASAAYLTSTAPGTAPPSSGLPAKVVNRGLIAYNGKRIALTFDDGGTSAQVLSILNTLDRYGVKSTFFPNGTWIRSNPGLAREIAARGHIIENHSLSHPDLTNATDAEVRRQIREGRETIRSTVGTTSYLLRPPYGAYDSRVLRIAGEEGMKYAVLWSVDTSDWATTRYGVTITPDYIVNHTLQNASNNGIVLMHLHSDKTVEALPRVIQGLRDRGYTFATVNEMLP